MTTNDEIIKKLEKRLHDEFLVPPLLFVQLEALVDKQARSDTAQEIFAKLEKIIVNLPPSTKKPVIKVIFPRGYDYKALKKEYKVD